MEKPNRAERRKNRFGGGRASEHGGWPTVEPNPVFKDETAADEAEAAEPETDAQPAPETKAATAKKTEAAPD